MRISQLKKVEKYVLQPSGFIKSMSSVYDVQDELIAFVQNPSSPVVYPPTVDVTVCPSSLANKADPLSVIRTPSLTITNRAKLLGDVSM